MSYISNSGQAIGPIKIENIWAGSLSKDKIYLAFARDTNTLKAGAEHYAPLLAETPTSSAPSNAVATIEWVKQYTTAGNQQLDLSIYATKTEVSILRNNISSLQYKVEQIENESNYYVEELENLKNENSIIIRNIESNRQSILENSSSIESIQSDINDINVVINALSQKVTDNSNNILKNANNIAINASNIQKNAEDIILIREIVEEANQNANNSITMVTQLYNEVEVLKTNVSTNTSNIEDNTLEINSIKETLEEYKDLIINPFPSGIIIKCGGAAL